MIYRLRNANEFAERKVATEYLTASGNTLTRPWALIVDGVIVAKCSTKAPLIELRETLGHGEIARQESPEIF